MYCIFCYAEYFDIGDHRHEVDNQRRKRQSICQRFFKTLQDELGLSLRTYSGSIALESACENCLQIASDYCQLIYQIKCLNLRLIDKTHELLDVIQSAGTNVVIKSQFLDNYISPEEIPAIQDFRRDIVDRCSTQAVIVEASGKSNEQEVTVQSVQGQACVEMSPFCQTEFDEEVGEVYLSTKIEDDEVSNACDDGLEAFQFPVMLNDHEQSSSDDFARPATIYANNTEDKETELNGSGENSSPSDSNDASTCNDELSCHKPPPAVNTLTLNCGKELWNNAEDYKNKHSTQLSKRSFSSALGIVKKWVCQQCNFRFSTKSNMKRHIIKKHGLPAFKEQEDYYNQLHSSKPSWTKGIHFLLSSRAKKKKQRTFIYKKQHECPLCQKRCRDKTKLGEHLRSHSGERPFCCGLCLKTFTTKSNVKRHINSVHQQAVYEEPISSILQSI